MWSWSGAVNATQESHPTARSKERGGAGLRHLLNTYPSATGNCVELHEVSEQTTVSMEAHFVCELSHWGEAQMVELVTRSPTAARLFPRVGWKQSQADKHGAADLAKAALEAISRRSLENGRGLRRKLPLRAVWLHCEAAAAEASGRLEYADFLYREIDRDLKLIDAAAGWNAVAELSLTPPAASGLDKGVLRQVAIEELFIDTHLAFFNSAATSGLALSRSHRSYLHLERADALRRLAAGQENTGPDPFELSLARARLSIMKTDNAWEDAVDFAAGYALRISDRPAYATELAITRFGELSHCLSRANGEAQQISIVERTIEALEGDRKVCPLEPIVHELLGHAYRQLAIFKTNNRQLPEALVDIRRSIDRWGHDDARDLERQLHDTMTGMQSRMREVQKEMGPSWYTRLTPEGEQLRKIASVGTSLLEAYLAGDERKEIERSSRAARAASIHRRLGFGTLAAGHEAHALALLDFLDDLINQAGNNPITRTDAEMVAASHRGVLEMDLDVIVSFLRDPSQFTFDSGEAFPPGHQETAPVASPGIASMARHKGIPSRIWFRSRQSRPWRAAAAISLLVGMAGCGVFAFDMHHRMAKTNAYSSILAGWVRMDEEATADAIRQFRAINTLAMHDERASVVDGIEANLQELPNQRIRQAAFEGLLQASEKGRHLAAIEAAERYLSAPTMKVSDLRLMQVRDLYAQHLVRWLATAGETSVGEREVERRLQNYRKLNGTNKI